jgi:hypothetical protein
LCTAESPNSFNKSTGKENHAPGVTSDSDQSDGESLEEMGPCEQSGGNVDIKRMRRFGLSFSLFRFPLIKICYSCLVEWLK